MGDDRVQKSKDRIHAWTAQQVENGDQTGAAQAHVNQPQTDPVDMDMQARHEKSGVVVRPDEVETILEDAPGSLARDRVSFKTPERAPAIKRSQGDGGGPDTIRR